MTLRHCVSEDSEAVARLNVKSGPSPGPPSLKRRVDARAGIPACWIVNLVDSQLEVFTNPCDTGGAADYSSEAILTRTGVVTLSLPNHVPLKIAVADLVR